MRLRYGFVKQEKNRTNYDDNSGYPYKHPHVCASGLMSDFPVIHIAATGQIKYNV